MITLKQARTLRMHDRISYTPTPLPGDPQEPAQLGTVTAVLPAFNLPYRTVPARVLITWDQAGQLTAYLDAKSQDFWNCVEILELN